MIPNMCSSLRELSKIIPIRNMILLRRTTKRITILVIIPRDIQFTKHLDNPAPSVANKSPISVPPFLEIARRLRNRISLLLHGTTVEIRVMHDNLTNMVRKIRSIQTRWLHQIRRPHPIRWPHPLGTERGARHKPGMPMPKGLKYKTSWQAFCTKFNYCAAHYSWSPDECKTHMCWSLAETASDYFAILVERNRDIDS
jgi:hypothetical protein